MVATTSYVSYRTSRFSAKLVNSIETVVKPLLDQGGPYSGKVKAIMRLHVQPWHGSSTFTHEAGVAVSLSEMTPFYMI